MKRPEVYTANEIRRWDTDTEYTPGCWYPARPYGFTGGFLKRLKNAWYVFTGKYDALNWQDI